MSSTLYFKKTPSTSNARYFKGSLKNIIGERFYGHSGGSSSVLTIGAEDISWFRGLYAGFNGEAEDMKNLEKIIELLERNETVDIWFEY